MKIIGERKHGYIIDASKKEVKDILKANGVEDPDPNIGSEISVANYLGAIHRFQNFVEKHDFTQLNKYTERFNRNYNQLKELLNKLTAEE